MIWFRMFQEESWDRWMDDYFIKMDTRRLDRRKDRCLLEYMAVYGRPDVSEWAMKALGVSEVPDSIGGIGCAYIEDKVYQRHFVVHEQVMRETDYWVLEKAAYEAPGELAYPAFCRITGISCPEPHSTDDIYDPGPYGLKQHMSRDDIEQLCREMIERDGPYAREAKEWLEKLPEISDETLAEWAAPKTERSWDSDPTERLKGYYMDQAEEDAAGEAGLSREKIREARIRDIYDAFMYQQYAGEHPRSSGLIFDETLDWFSRRVVMWYERRRKKPVSMTASVRLVLRACGEACDDLTEEKIRKAAYEETEDKRRHGFYIGVDLLYGFETEGDAAASVRYLTDAAEAGNKYALEELIDIYEEGIGVKKNPWLAKKLRKQYEEAEKQ